MLLYISQTALKKSQELVYPTSPTTAGVNEFLTVHRDTENVV